MTDAIFECWDGLSHSLQCCVDSRLLHFLSSGSLKWSWLMRVGRREDDGMAKVSPYPSVVTNMSWIKSSTVVHIPTEQRPQCCFYRLTWDFMTSNIIHCHAGLNRNEIKSGLQDFGQDLHQTRILHPHFRTPHGDSSDG